MSTPWTERRFGTFRIPAEMIRTRTADVLRIMAQCAVVRAETHLISDVVEYSAASPAFRPVSLGEIAPTYAWCVTPSGVTAVEEAATARTA